MPQAPFPWPQRRRAALALTYDDCMPGHQRLVAPRLHAAGLHATFFTPTNRNLFLHADGWRAVAAMGHELGNHTCFHPCRYQPGKTWGRDFELDRYTVRQWAAEVELASQVLGLLDGRSERTYGNTCHQETIGPDGAEESLLPAIRERFAAGRGRRQTPGFVADPWTCDLASIGTVSGDRGSAADLLAQIDAVIAAGGLLIITFHAVGPADSAHLFIDESEHERLIDGLAARQDQLWTAPLVAIAGAIRASR